MANDLKYTAALRNTMLDAITTAADVGTDALLRIYDGTPPADADTALSGNDILAELTMATTSFGAASAGVLTAASITAETSAPKAGTNTATFFRLVTSAGAAVLQGTVGTSDADLNLTSVSITQGDNVSVDNFWTITGGNA